jgi:hypothetical protein
MGLMGGYMGLNTGQTTGEFGAYLPICVTIECFFSDT